MGSPPAKGLQSSQTPPSFHGRQAADPGLSLTVFPMSGSIRGLEETLTKLGLTIGPSTVYEILRAAGIDPAPRRDGPTWRQFLHEQAAGILAADFLQVDADFLQVDADFLQVDT